MGIFNICFVNVFAQSGIFRKNANTTPAKRKAVEISAPVPEQSISKSRLFDSSCKPKSVVKPKLAAVGMVSVGSLKGILKKSEQEAPGQTIKADVVSDRTCGNYWRYAMFDRSGTWAKQS